MASLSDTVRLELLDGNIPDPSLPIRLASYSDTKCVQKTIENLQTAKVLILQLPRMLQENLEERNVPSVNDFYGESHSFVLRSASWMALPCPKEHPKMAQFLMKFTSHQRSAIKEYMVKKMVRLRSLGIRENIYNVAFVRQSREWVHLYVQNCPDVEQNVVLRIKGLNPDLNGCFVASSYQKNSRFRIQSCSKLFPRSKTPVKGTVSFEAELEEGRTLYEIDQITPEKSREVFDPFKVEWESTDIVSESSSDEEGYESDESQKEENPHPEPLPMERDLSTLTKDWDKPLPNRETVSALSIRPTAIESDFTASTSQQRYRLPLRMNMKNNDDRPPPKLSKRITLPLVRKTNTASRQQPLQRSIPEADLSERSTSGASSSVQPMPKERLPPVQPMPSTNASVRRVPAKSSTIQSISEESLPKPIHPGTGLSTRSIQKVDSPECSIHEANSTVYPMKREDSLLGPTALANSSVQFLSVASSSFQPIQANLSEDPTATPHRPGPKSIVMDYYEHDKTIFNEMIVSRIVSNLDSPEVKNLFQRLVQVFGFGRVRSTFDSETASIDSDPIPDDRDVMTSYSDLWETPRASPGQFSQSSDKGGIIPPFSLRNYQRKAVDKIMNPGNFVLGSGTGSGKTLIFIEVARRMLMENKHAKVFVVVPTINLTEQHVVHFDCRGFSKHGFSTVACYGGKCSNPSVMLSNSVIVITPERLKQHLQRNEIAFPMIQLLVLDEVHHTKGASPYQEIVKKYHYLNDIQRANTKIIGFSATPAQGRHGGSINANLEALLTSLHVPEQNFIVIDDTNEEIRETIPQAEEEDIFVETRPKDDEFRKFLAKFTGDCLQDIIPNHFKSSDLSHLLTVRVPSYFTMLQDDNGSSQFNQYRYDIVSRLNATSSNDFEKKDIEEAIDFVCFMDEAVQLSRDVGYEAASSNLLMTARQKRMDLSVIITECKKGPSGSLFSKIERALSASSFAKMLPTSIQSCGFAVSAECGGYPKFAKLIDILEKFKYTEAFHSMVFIRTRYAVDQICTMLKESRLKDFMEFESAVGRGQSSKSNSVLSTRSSVGQVCALQSSNPLNSIQGMSAKELNEALNWFRQDGKRVLVTTSVCEEGVDVPSCELVIRYNPALTGTEYTQSRGRARKIGARMINIIEEGTKDKEHIRRCRKDIQESKKVITNRTTVFHI